MGSRYKVTAFFGLVFDGPEQEGDWNEARDSKRLALPAYSSRFAIAAKGSVVTIDPDEGDAGPYWLRTTRDTSHWRGALRAWCKATGRPWMEPRWYLSGAWL